MLILGLLTSGASSDKLLHILSEFRLVKLGKNSSHCSSNSSMTPNRRAMKLAYHVLNKRAFGR